jgi:F-type H+-transporting ATPase subunit b
MALITPGIGLIFWMLISFSIVLFILKKYAWKPILESLKDRESSIANALSQAEKARQAMAELKADNETILKEAREEQSRILAEAREIRDKIVAEAKDKAQEEADKLVSVARENIENEKMAAMTEIKNHIATLSIDIAEKILKSQLAEDAKQKELVNTLLEDVKLN